MAMAKSMITVEKKEGGREGERDDETYLPVTKPVKTEGLMNFMSEPTRKMAMAQSMMATAKEMTAATSLRTWVWYCAWAFKMGSCQARRIEKREGGREEEGYQFFYCEYQCCSSPSLSFLLPSSHTLSLLARGMPSLVKVSDMKRETSATGPMVSCPDVPKREYT